MLIKTATVEYFFFKMGTWPAFMKVCFKLSSCGCENCPSEGKGLKILKQEEQPFITNRGMFSLLKFFPKEQQYSITAILKRK